MYSGGDMSQVAHVDGPPRGRLTLLGGFLLAIDGVPASIPVAAQRLVAVLALRGRCGRSRLAGELWPETTEDRALARLRTTIWRAHLQAPGLVAPDHDALALAGSVDVDVTDLVRSAHELMDGRSTLPVERVLLYVEGDLLPDWSDEWLTAERERLRQLRLHVLETVAARLAAEGLFGMAMEAALAALRSDPLRESAHRAVIRIHLAEGNLAEAVHAYRQCQSLLARELGVAPSEEAARLVAALPALR
ncbi:BTAD domain-containing putative transcriptional regulator [Cellulomonas sp. Root137]|uniref:AfsR/SARP family transcriptional regulator n=1 Tax=Cellulomonas sp. Root137 TaxID=1736459 RepID=UPI001F3FC3B9|nr:BTAD domain-containing putative transcriptional regulator [Cellulomonas sp. Root137]